MPDEKNELLEKEILNQVKDAIAKSIVAALAGYNSPLNKMIEVVIARKHNAIELMLERAVDEALTGDLKADLQTACSHKLARVLISKMEGEIEKRANDLRANPEFRAKLTVAIANAVKGLVPEGS